MKIIELRAENFKRLKAVTIRPNGNMVEITGANGNGKSSVMDAMWAAFKGKLAGVVEPIRKGAEKATLMLQLGDQKVEWTIHREFKRDKDGEITTSLKVLRADGSPVAKSPQAVIDAFLGAFTFDPLAFARAKSEDQFEALKRFVAGFDFEANSAARKKLFDERTDVNRNAKRERSTALSIELPPGPKPAAPDGQALIDKLASAASHNASIEQLKRARQEQAAGIESKRDEAETLRARAATLERLADAAEKGLAGMPQPPEPMNVDAIRAELGAAERIKGVIVMHENRERHDQAAIALENRSKLLTEKIDELDETRAKAIEAAKLPVEGLTLGDDVVLYKDLPFSEASQAEKLVVSCAIGMAQNPDLRVLRTYDGSLLDSKSRGVIAAMAKSRDFQMWLERVDESGEIGFVIENGEVAANG